MDFDQLSAYWDNKADKQKGEALKEDVDTFLKEHNTCALATGYDHYIRNTPIEYSYIDGYLYMMSEGGHKFKALKHNLNACIAIYEDLKSWGTLRGLQLTGHIEFVEGLNEEYRHVLEIKKIPASIIEKMDSPMSMLKFSIKSADMVDAKFKKEGFDPHQHLDY